MSGQDHMETCLYLEVLHTGMQMDASILFPLACNTVNINEENTQIYILYPYYTLDALYNSAELKTCFCHAWSDIYKHVNILYNTVYG